MIDIVFLAKLILPLFILVILFSALITRTDAYSAFVSGGKEGLQMAAELLPFLVGMMAAISVLRSSGLLLWITNLLSPLFLTFHIPAELFPLFLTRPISGTAALSITADLTHTYGTEHIISRMAAVIQGSTDTTLYILTVYFGAVGIKKMGRALAVGLLADLTGMILAVVITLWYFQNVWS